MKKIFLKTITLLVIALLVCFFKQSSIKSQMFSTIEKVDANTVIEKIVVPGNPTKSLIENNKNSKSTLEQLKAESAVIIDEKSKKTLFQKNPNKKLYPASTTKILTALLAIEYGDIDEIVQVGNEINLVMPDASKAGLIYGEKIELENLLRALLLPSGNDAAYVIAVHIARKASGNNKMTINNSLVYFRDMMNERLKKIGANNSHFTNPDGYHNTDHYTTAHDLALIACEAMKKDIFKKVVKAYSYKMTSLKAGGNTNTVREWINTNKLIDKNSEHYYKYATGIKTGYTSDAQYCLVSSASKNGKNVIAVVLKDTQKDQWTDSINLLEYGLK